MRAVTVVVMLAVVAGATTAPTPLGAAVPRCKGKVATIVGSSGNDTILGTIGADVIVSLGGGDVIYGLGSADTICSGTGNDTVYGGGGGDTLVGGSGADEIYGQYGKDKIRGSRNNDELYGGPGSDRIWGGKGADHGQGGANADALYGYSGADTLLGGNGHDLIDGAGGANHANGADGRDACFKSSNTRCEKTWLRNFREVANDCESPGWRTGRVDGRLWERSLVCPGGLSVRRAVYHLNRDYRLLTATLGQADGSKCTLGTAKFTVKGDQQVISTFLVGFGVTRKITVDVTNVRRLAFNFANAPGSPCQKYGPVVGSPTVSANRFLTPRPPL